MSGRFITFEGGEGSGKSTQLRMLADFLKQKNQPVCCTKEPGGTPIGLALRKILVEGEASKMDARAETLLFYADRHLNLTQNVWPALTQGKYVLCDRFADSTVAYQYYAYDKQLSKEEMDHLYAFAVGDFKPDLTFILDIDPKIGLKRSFHKAEAMADKETRNESRELIWHERLRKGYLEIAKTEPDRCVVLNADQPAETLHREIVQILTEKYGEIHCLP